MSKNIYNFSAGPAALPLEVIDTIKSEINDFDQGMSVMEVSHRSSAFKKYAQAHKGVFYKLRPEKKTIYIENSIKNDQKFRNFLKGIIIGMFTVEEYNLYKLNSSSLNKRMMNLVFQRLSENLQLFEYREDVKTNSH